MHVQCAVGKLMHKNSASSFIAFRGFRWYYQRVRSVYPMSTKVANMLKYKIFLFVVSSLVSLTVLADAGGF